MKKFISFIIVTVYLTISSMTFAEYIKGKENIPSNVKEKKITFTNRLSKNGPELKFEMYGKFKNGYLKKGHINVYNMSSAKHIQKIIINNNFETGHYDWAIENFEYNGSEVQMVDINFDGYLDLRLLDNEGATGNNWYGSYIYDRPSGKFKLHHDISALSGVRIDANNKQIITFDTGGSCSEIHMYYKVVNNKLVLIKADWLNMDRTRDAKAGGFGCFMYTGIPRHAGVQINPTRLFYPEYFKDGGQSYMLKIMKDIKEKPMQGSLDLIE